MAKSKTPTPGMINFASIEMVKACIFYASGRINLRQNDVISSGVNFYFGAFHNCVSVIALSPDGTFLEKGIIEWKDRFNAPKWYIPCSHKELLTKTRKIDKEFAKVLRELRDIREYLNYGPYVCSDHTPDWKPIIYTCEIEDIKQKLETYDLRLSDMFCKTPELVNRSLPENHQKFVFCWWGDGIFKIFRGELIFNNRLYNECQELWAQIRKHISPKTQRTT